MKPLPYLTLLFTALIGHAAEPQAVTRLGIIGLDTSHVTAFTKLINSGTNSAGMRVVAAFKGGSPDIESSANRVEEYTAQMQKEFGVKIVKTIEELCDQVDGILLESVDGRPHLEQARPVIARKKPLFIDKPVAGSLRDAIEIFRLAKEANVPVFTASAYRFYDSMQELKKAPVGRVTSVISYGPAHLEAHHPDLYWYGVHPSEALFTVLGTGCQTVSSVSTPDSIVVTGTWSEGRLGTLIGLRTGPTPHKVLVFGTKAVAEQKGSGTYAPLVAEIIQFFKTGVAPVKPEETLELFAFMEAADESKRQGGKPVSIPDLLRQHAAPAR